MYRFMRPNTLALGLGVLILLLGGMRFGALPFLPDAHFSDAVVSHWPAAHYLRQSVLERGEFPLWRETIMGGQPFAANPLNKTAYPPQVLALIFEPATFLDVMIALHLLLAGWGMWKWARLLGLSEVSSALSGLAYAFAPKLIGHLGAGHVDVLYALAWWPWLMWSVQSMIEGPFSLRRILQTALLTALLILSDVRLSLFALGFAALYALWLCRGRWTSLFRFAPVGLLGVLLTLSVIIPLVGWQPYLNRGALTAAEAGMLSLEPGQLIGLLLPPHGGSPETLTYLSLPVLLLAGIALVSAPRKYGFWIVMLSLFGLWALGINGVLWPLLIQTLPVLLWFRVPARAWFVVVLVGCLLAGYGLQTLMQSVDRLRQGEAVRRLGAKRLAVAGGMGASLLCGGFTLAVLGDLPQSVGIGVLVIGFLLGLVLLLAFYGRLSGAALGVALLVILALDLGWTGRQWLEWRPQEAWLYHQEELVSSLSQAIQQLPYARIYSPNYALEQQVAEANGWKLFGGVDPFQVRGVVEAISAGSGIATAGYSVVQPPLVDAESDMEIAQANCEVVLGPGQRQILADWGVRYIVSRCPLQIPYGAEGENIEPFHIVDGSYLYLNPDYMLRLNPITEGWPSGWNLPTPETIQQLNTTTETVALISALSFVFCLVLLAWKMRSTHD